MTETVWHGTRSERVAVTLSLPAGRGAILRSARRVMIPSGPINLQLKPLLTEASEDFNGSEGSAFQMGF